MKKNCDFILAFLFLIAVIFLTWFIFFYVNIINDSEMRLAGIFSSLGLGFGLFQFWFNTIKTDRRRDFDLKYSAYKEIVLLVDSISETLNENMISTQIIEVHGLVSKLVNQINRLSSTMNEHNVFLFPEIIKSTESIKISEIMENILLRTDKYRIDVEKAIKQGSVNNNFLETMHTLTWHNEIRKFLNKFHTNKYQLYRKIRSYF